MAKKSVEENCDLLFEYLGDILYDDNAKPIDLQELDLEFRQLGEGLKLLQQFVIELKEYTADLSMGNLSGKFPSRDNFLCTNLKNLHANLNHLTWQAKQVAEGDYTQRVSYLGEFSDSFNAMITQLKERESLLKKKSMQLETKAYEDALTGIYNRYFMIEYYEGFIKEDREGIVCYMDLDGLKYVNDRYGHNEGDAYLSCFVSLIKKHFRNSDVFARLGGDEFCLLLTDISEEKVLSKLQRIRDEFIEQNNKEYPVSFSFGVVKITTEARNKSWEEMLEIADQRMYEYKKEHKKNRT